MSWPGAFALWAFLSANVDAAPTQPPATDGYEPAKYSVELQKSSQSPMSSQTLSNFAKIDTNSLSPVDQGSGWAINVTLGTQGVFSLIFDTGSSDLFVPRSDYKCMNEAFNETVATSVCNFHRTFSGPPSDGLISDENFKVKYDDVETVEGQMVRETVSIGDIAIKNQEIALASSTNFRAQGAVDGMIGFAYGGETSAFHGTNPADDKDADEAVYVPWLHNAINDKLIAPNFTLALERGADGAPGRGFLGLGGIPAGLKFNPDFAEVPIQRVNLGGVANGANIYTFYTVDIGGVELAGDLHGPGVPMVVDSGTSVIYLPPDLASVVNGAFKPPATKNVNGQYVTPCNAVRPAAFGVRIGSKSFLINPLDLIPPGAETLGGKCITGVQESTSGFYILGDVFLKNVVAVFDLGTNRMKFAEHSDY